MLMSIIVLAVSASVGTVLAIAKRAKLYRHAGWLTALAMVAAIAGPMLTVIAGREIVTAREIKRWPTVQGIVTKSEVVGNRAIRPLVFYQYRVGGTTYSDSSSLGVPPFGNRRVRLDESETIAAEYKAGDSVKIHYDPTTPGRSTLYAREDWASYLRLTIGAMLFGVGLFFLVGFGMSIGRS